MIEICNEAILKNVTQVEFCDVIGVPVRTFIYWKKQINKIENIRGRKTSPSNKLRQSEVMEVKKAILNQKTSDLSPREIYYKILDEENKIIASVSTFYRIAKKENLLTKRIKTTNKNALNREMPVLKATGPNQIWSWDVSQISSTTRNIKFYLYVIIDIWSRLIVGWKLEEHEETEHAIEMWKDALESQYITGKGLTNHKDNGSIMRSNEMLKFVRDVGMIDSYSRAGVSDDNPFSEAFFRTLKYFRNYPKFFEKLERGRAYFTSYFNEYNYDNRHSGIQFVTPAQRHYGEEEKIHSIRNRTIELFYNKNAHRYTVKPKYYSQEKEVTIN